MIKIFSLFLTFTFFLSSLVFAEELTWNNRLSGSDLYGGNLLVEDGDFYDLSAGLFTDVSMYSYVRLGISERELMTYTAGNVSGTTTFTVDVTITPYSNAGVLSASPITQTLSIVYSVNGQAGVTVDASDYRLTGVHKFRLSIGTIKLNGVTQTATGIPNYLYVEGGCYADRSYTFSDADVPSVYSAFITFDANGAETRVANTGFATTATTDELELGWGYVQGAAYYELEWSWVDNYTALSGTTRPRTDVTFQLTDLDFKNNSTRIRTTGHSYRIPQVFAKGYLIYRVRAVGRWNSTASQDKYGSWSSGTTSKQKVGDWPHYVEIGVEHASKLNWQYQATYAEDGKKKEVTQYFDGSLRGRQTVTRINSDKRSVVGETIYDNEGRGVVQVLPVPQSNPAIRFYPKLNTNASGNPYSHKDFDWESTAVTGCSPQPVVGMSTGTGASNYYSPQGNPAGGSGWQQYVADAEGYPFTQVEYTPDNTGRIRSQSGVGSTHKLGSGHQTDYYYMQPRQEELNRLFGYKVGYMTRYKKNMVIDANGQVSVSYLDAQGRVIATALSGDNRTNFSALPSAAATAQRDTSDLLGENNVLFSTGRFGAASDALKIGTQLGVVEDGSVYDFEYTADPKFYRDSCEEGDPLIYPYVYDLTLSLRNDCGTELFAHTYTQIGLQQFGAATSDFTAITEHVTLQRGTYTLYKEIKVNEQSLAAYRDHYLDTDSNGCLLGNADFSDTVSTDCGTSCAECVEALGTLAAYLQERSVALGSTLSAAQITFYTNIFNELKARCNAPCQLLTNCSVYHGLLINDLLPGGQYGGFVKPDGSVDNVLNVFAPSNNLGVNWRSLIYLDEYGNRDSISVSYNATTGKYSPALLASFTTYNNSTSDVVFRTTPNNLLKDSAFVALFEPAWAEALLPYHPEYKLYTYSLPICNTLYAIPGSTMPLSSDAFDAVLRDEILTFAQASDAAGNAFNIDFVPGSGAAIHGMDPYFNITYASIHDLGSVGTYGPMDNTSQKTALMTEALTTNYNGTGLHMLAYAARTVLCGNNYVSCSVTNAYSWADVIAITNVSTRDAIWSTYKSYYLSYKAKINQLLQDMYAFKGPNRIYNGCIGPDGLDYGLLSSMSFSGQYISLRDRIYALWGMSGTSFTTLPTALCAESYNTKAMRFVRIDALYNAALPADSIIAEGSATAAYEAWTQTGICKDLQDMENFFNALGQQDKFKSPVQMSQFNAFVPNLFRLIRGAAPVAGDDMTIAGAVSGSNLSMTFKRNSSTLCTLTLPQIGSLSWADYNTPSTGWHIYAVSHSYPGTGNQVSMLVKAGTTLSAAQEYVLTFTSCVNLNSCQATYSAGNALSADCKKEEQLETALLTLMQRLKATGVFFNTGVSLSGYPEYTQSVLPSFLGGTSPVWNGPSSGLVSLSSASNSNYLRFSFPTSLTSGTLLGIASVDIVGLNLYVQGFGTSGPVTPTSNLNFTYQRNGVKTNLNLNCPCEEPEERVAAVTRFINDLLARTTVAEGLQPESLEDLLPYLNVSNPAIYQFVRSTGGFQFMLSYNGSSYDCAVTLTNAAPTVAIVSISNLVFTGTSFTCTALLANGKTAPLTGRFPCLQDALCPTCLPQPEPPLSCNTAFTAYSSFFNTKFQPAAGPDQVVYNDEYALSLASFCEGSLAYISTAYQSYITNSTLGINSLFHARFVSIAQFGSTPLGYSNTKLSAAVTAFAAYVSANPASTMDWNTYVATVYMPANPTICPASSPAQFSGLPASDTIPMPCDQWENQVGVVNAINQQNIYLAQLGNAFTESYIAGAMSSLVESFTETHAAKEFHYTLYYYDRAGNLIQTVPPAGVNRLNNLTPGDNTNINAMRVYNPAPNVNVPATIEPVHTLQTVYHYNSLNQLVHQKTPDGGESRFVYDALGRLVMSQNALQKTPAGGNSRYSYTRYDALGRVAEAGQLALSNTNYYIDTLTGLLMEQTPFLRAITNFETLILGVADALKTEVTRTIYDELKVGTSPVTTPMYPSGSAAITSLFGADYAATSTRNRIVGVIYQSVYAASVNTYDNGTFYDYDVHGNVKHLMQINRDANLRALNQHIKHLRYSYDLVSGNVNEVIYQKGEADQFMHRYAYDADNRITKVETSSNGIHWEKDAKYFYYAHGPLARKEIGEAKVQAEDYAYTIQGWLKSVNGEQLNSSTAMGKDNQPSTINANGAKDAFGYSLSYFNGDYNSANTTMLGFSKHAAIGTQLGPDLYNGNIRAMHTALSDPTTETIQGGYTHQTVYKYDQLNRIIGMNGFKAITPGVSPDSSGYKSAYSYDANGNLQTMNNLSANASGVATPMDAFVYNYKPNTNQLTHVDDAITATNFAVDLDDQAANNYSYDAIGQLIGDVAENITSITWTVTNKVKTVTYGGSLAGKSITFNYDAMGHRISKQVTATNGDVTTTYYVLDAQGNPMSTYERKKDGSVYNMYLAERNIYGSSRLGSEDMNQQMTASTPAAPGANYAASNAIGDKRYELANHLGNVLNVVTDRKLPIATGTFPNQTVGAYTADVVSYSDYYPFGMALPNRNLSDYRYGFQGQERDDELKGKGNSLNYEFRMHDPRVGRFFAVDPLAPKYPHNSPYAFSENKVIAWGELEGLESYFAADGTKLGQIGNNTQVRVVNTENLEKVRIAFVLMNQGGHNNYADDLFKASKDVGMNEGELYVRAFLSTIKQTESDGKSKLGYNSKHGFENGKVKTFTQKSYAEAPEDYQEHPYVGASGGTAAGAYQILLPTFNLYKKAYPNDIVDFSPESQDKLVLGIFSRTGALTYIKIGDVQNAVAKLTKAPVQFSSLPGGGEERGMTQSKVEGLFKANVSLELNKNSDIATPQGQTLQSVPND